jgi:hypothetical protein
MIFSDLFKQCYDEKLLNSAARVQNKEKLWNGMTGTTASNENKARPPHIISLQIPIPY